MVSFSITTTLRCKRGRYSNTWSSITEALILPISAMLLFVHSSVNSIQYLYEVMSFILINFFK